jgi:hypothetical protein
MFHETALEREIIMKTKMFKELSRPIIFIVLIYICVCSFAEAQPGNSILKKLEARLCAYKDAFKSKDYVQAASFVSPNKIKRFGIDADTSI